MGLFSSKQENPGKRERELAEDRRRRDFERDFYKHQMKKLTDRQAGKSK